MRGEFFEERVQMMSWWSDYLDGLAAQEKVASQVP